MKVAVVTARSASGDAGGAERFYEALVQALNESGHVADEVPVVANEATFDHILKNYVQCYDLDLSAYDLVISTKSPTWMVRHPRHVCYLVHTIRVFYDMYDEVFPDAGPELEAQRLLVHRLDSLALSPPRCRAVYAIGKEVADRLAKWNGLQAGVLHPPLWSDHFRTGPFGDYLLLPGRLHPWKRVDLVIQAMRHVKAPLRLVITGTGEAEAELRELAGNDKRIEFHGQVSDERLVELYAGALAVPFTPNREDYGYVTLEAFASGKPVITCSDSGEAAAIVEHCRSGYVCKPDASAIGKHIEKLWENPRQAAEFGRQGQAWVERQSWRDIARILTQ